MKTFIFLIAVLFTAATAQSYEADRQRKEVAAYFQGGSEPSAKDAIWTANNIFKVGVIDNGSSRDGYALYVCEVLRERGLDRGTWVQIIDIVKLTSRGKWEKLGEARCK